MSQLRLNRFVTLFGPAAAGISLFFLNLPLFMSIAIIVAAYALVYISWQDGFDWGGIKGYRNGYIEGYSESDSRWQEFKKKNLGGFEEIRPQIDELRKKIEQS